MSVEVKPGRWRTRGNGEAIVKHSMVLSPGEFALRFVWIGFVGEFAEYWDDQGLCRHYSLSLHDLIEYLGPEEQTGGSS